MPPGGGINAVRSYDADRFWSKRPVSVRQADLTASKKTWAALQMLSGERINAVRSYDADRF